MKQDVVKSEQLKSELMHNIHSMLDKCRENRLLVLDYDITSSKLLTKFLLQEVGAENVYLIMKAAASGVEYDLGPIRSTYPEIDCSHLCIIASYNKLSLLTDLNRKTGKEIVLLEDNSYILIQDEISMPFIHGFHLGSLLP